MEERISLLDCTLRDGGLGLEDAEKNGYEVDGFSSEMINKSIECLNKTGIEIVELGSIEITHDDKSRFGIYQSIEEVSKLIPQNRNNNTMYVALFRGPDTPIEQIPDYHEGLCEGIRVIMRYSELKKSVEFCKRLSEKGYKVFVQPMLTMRYTDEEIHYLIEESNEMNAYALYFVDSYGYMTEKDILRLFKVYDEGLSLNIRIGFHGHNNLNLAYSNALSFINIKSNRNIIVDSCVLGMGQGAGNLQTELIADKLIGKGKKYNYIAILDFCELIESFVHSNLWGYSLATVIAAINKTAYKYALVMRKKYKLSYATIYLIMQDVPDDLRQRYTPENLEVLIERYNRQK